MKRIFSYFFNLQTEIPFCVVVNYLLYKLLLTVFYKLLITKICIIVFHKKVKYVKKILIFFVFFSKADTLFNFYNLLNLKPQELSSYCIVGSTSSIIFTTWRFQRFEVLSTCEVKKSVTQQQQQKFLPAKPSSLESATDWLTIKSYSSSMISFSVWHSLTHFTISNSVLKF